MFVPTHCRQNDGNYGQNKCVSIFRNTLYIRSQLKDVKIRKTIVWRTQGQFCFRLFRRCFRENLSNICFLKTEYCRGILFWSFVLAWRKRYVRRRKRQSCFALGAFSNLLFVLFQNRRPEKDSAETFAVISKRSFDAPRRSWWNSSTDDRSRWINNYSKNMLQHCRHATLAWRW